MSVVENLVTYWPRIILAILFTISSAMFIKGKFHGRGYVLRVFASFIMSCAAVSIVFEILTRAFYNYSIKPVLPSAYTDSGVIFTFFFMICDILSYILPVYIYSKMIRENIIVSAIFYMQFTIIDRVIQIISFSPLSYVFFFVVAVIILRVVHRADLKYIFDNKDTVDWRPMFFYTMTLFVILDICFSAIYIFPDIQMNRLSIPGLWLDAIVVITSLSSIGFVKLNVIIGKEHDKRIAYMRKFQDNQTDIIRDFATISEAKSGETGQHIRRVSEYVAILADGILKDESEISYVKVASMMHDIGKLMIPNDIIEKPGKLTPEEYETIKEHSAYGESLLSRSQGEIMTIAQTIAYEHHERWDGKGYPRGLKGNQISIYAQIVSVADVYDALTSKRSYKDPWPAEDARKEIIGQRGYQFSPIVVDSFIRKYDEIDRIRKMYAD